LFPNHRHSIAQPPTRIPFHSTKALSNMSKAMYVFYCPVYK